MVGMRWLTSALACAVLMAASVDARGASARAQDARSGTATPAPVNLNAATAADLQALPGIGPAMAAKILEYRQKSGGFKKVEELMNIQGIGEKNFLKLRALVTVSAPRMAER